MGRDSERCNDTGADFCVTQDKQDLSQSPMRTAGSDKLGTGPASSYWKAVIQCPPIPTYLSSDKTFEYTHVEYNDG
jgi:hypothetical protein